jgi:serine/threonine protein kinase
MICTDAVASSSSKSAFLMPAKTIGRFEIIHELGRGAQGVVYLARDPQLGRQVAIKTWRADSSRETGKLLREARIASNLQHPNIVPVYDAGEHGGMPYLVYAYVEGSTLAKLIEEEGTLPLVQAAQIACGVLDALACAHEQGVMHLDIKPANIMIAADGHPMVMDFGIARMMAQQPEVTNGIFGTPQYMAPECFSPQGPESRSDLFSVGMMLYEMVTGAPAVEGGNIFQIINRTAHEQAAAPSSRNVRVDDMLEAIIMKAIAKKPDERYPDAVAMRQALQHYLDPNLAEIETDGESHSTLEFLLRRMRSNSDFPALSNTISEINTIVASESVSSGKLTQAILEDFALTNKLLKLVNTVSYGQFGGNIHTISKAVAILGFEAVRNIATSLILLEFLQNKAQAASLKDEIAVSYLAGMVASHLAHGYELNIEEARICAMFHNLGKMLAIYYFFEESQQIHRLTANQELSEEQAAIKVLGLSYNSLGSGVAKVWHLPGSIIAGMQKLPDEKIGTPRGDTEQMAVTVNLANELCGVAAASKPQDKERLLRQLCERYTQAAPVSEQGLSAALESGLHELSKRAAIIGIDMAKNPLLNKVSKWNGHVETGKPAEAENGTILLDAAAGGDKADGQGAAPGTDPETILSSGIQDVTNTLVDEFHLNDVLQVVLETIYCSLGFRHTLIFIRDDTQGVMAARFGFGATVDEIIPYFRFPLRFTPDVFHLAIDQGLDIVIEDVQAANIADKIPGWFRDAVDSQCFLLLPVMVNKRAVGLIYADMEEANALQISKRQLSLLRTLRNQAILAIKQKV